MEGVSEQDGKKTNILQRPVQVGGLYQQARLMLKSTCLGGTNFSLVEIKDQNNITKLHTHVCEPVKHLHNAFHRYKGSQLMGI